MLAKIVNTFRNPSSLGDRALGAGAWNVLNILVSYPLRIAGNLIMTQILAPDAFAMMAIVTALHTGLMLLSDVGIAQSVARDPRGEEPQFLRVAWTIQIIRGLIIVAALLGIGFGFLLLAGDLGANDTVYAEPLLPYLIWASSVGLLFKGFESANRMLARRLMRPGPVIIIQLIGQISGWVLMVGIGFTFGTVWALLSALVATNVVTCILTHVALKGPRMRLAWDRPQAVEMWHFGKWLIGSSLSDFVINNVDRIIIGAVVDKTSFGVYVIASLWVDVARLGLTRIGGSIFVPYFSGVTNSGGDLTPVVRKTFFYYSLLVFAAFGGVLVFFFYIFEHLYPDAYALAPTFGAVLAFRILPLCFAPFRGLLISMKHTAYIASATTGSAVFSVLLTYLLATNGSIYWAIAGFAIGSLPMDLVTINHRNSRQYITPWPYYALAAVGIAICVYVASIMSATYAA